MTDKESQKGIRSYLRFRIISAWSGPRWVCTNGYHKKKKSKTQVMADSNSLMPTRTKTKQKAASKGTIIVKPVHFIAGSGNPLSRLGEEVPGGIWSKRVLLSQRCADVTADIGDEGELLLGACEVRPCALAGIGGHCNVLCLAAVVLDEPVLELKALVHGEDGVFGSVELEEVDRVGAALAAADLPATDDAHGAEDLGAGAGEGKGHGGTVREAGAETLVGVDAQARLELLDHGVGEGDVAAAVVGPFLVDAVGGHKDGGALGAGLEAVPGLDAHASDDVLHAAEAPVPRKDELHGGLAVVSVGELEGVLPLEAIDVDLAHARGEGGVDAAAAVGLGREGAGGKEAACQRKGRGERELNHFCLVPCRERNWKICKTREGKKME